MCGIGGWLGPLPGSENHAARMAQTLNHHRGPDASGIRSWSEATLVQTRLSINRLVVCRRAAMANEGGTIWTVFNGEIFNHRELRHGLENHGHTFKGHSDTRFCRISMRRVRLS
jgi:asparagine synthase (glutamine-hydrolysing)